MSAPTNHTGKKYHRLIAIEKGPSHRSGDAMWWCLCDCGNKKLVSSYHLKAGNIKSCGCLAVETRAANNTRCKTTHGLTRNNRAMLKRWANMISRCEDPRRTDYFNYGGRGIRVCERWHDPVLFIKDMGDRPEGMTLDRINNDGDYEPSNCRWATWRQQRMNQRRMYAKATQ